MSRRKTQGLRLLTLCLLHQMLGGASAFVCCILFCSAKLIAAQIDPDIKLTLNTTSIHDGDVIEVLLHSLLLLQVRKHPRAASGQVDGVQRSGLLSETCLSKGCCCSL